MTELTKLIKVKENVDEDGSNFSEYFPDFCFLLRDFTYKLEIKGKSVDSNQYMEGILEHQEGDSENTQLYNEPRECITTFFPHRRCYTLGKPVVDDEQLTALDQLKTEDLKPIFVKKSKWIVEDILKRTKPFCIKNNTITGSCEYNIIVKMLFNLIIKNIHD